MIESFAANEQTPLSKSILTGLNLEETRPPSLKPLYDLAGASDDDRFVFTSSGAEAINQVLWSVFLKVSRETGKCHFITSALEDAATLQMMKRLEELGCFVKIAPVNHRGEIDIEALKSLINPRTALLSLSMAQGMTGVIQPVEEIVAYAQEKGVLVHLDATHAMGKYYLPQLQASYLTFSGDRIHSVIGSGGLFAKKQAPLVPLILGGNPLRGGASDIPSLTALCTAALESYQCLDAMSLEIARLRNDFEEAIQNAIPGAIPLFSDSLRLPNTSVIAFPNVHQEALYSLLLSKKIKTTLGGNYSQHLSSLLTASGISPSIAECAIHFSLSRMTKKEALLSAVEQIRTSVLFLQNIACPEGINATLFPKHPCAMKSSIELTKKGKEKIKTLQFAGSFSPQLAEEKGMRYVVGKEANVCFYWLVDETDGVIADVKFQAFGPLSFIAAAETLAEMTIRKTYKQASRITADLIDKGLRDHPEENVFSQEGYPLLNQLISALDQAAALCEDIPCSTQDYKTPIDGLNLENQNGLPEWETLPLEQKKQLIEEVVHKEIRPYIQLDEGDIRILDIKENEIQIAYEGSCTSCYAATGSTLSAIQQILRARLHPHLVVIPNL